MHGGAMKSKRKRNVGGKWIAIQRGLRARDTRPAKPLGPSWRRAAAGGLMARYRYRQGKN